MTDLAGFRLLRRAAVGARARLDVGFAEGRSVVLKSTPLRDAATMTEVGALERAAGAHVVALDDLASDAERRVLVLEHLPGGSVADLLERRDGLAAGEAVTLLVPIAATVERLHAAGVAHGQIGADSVVLSRDGAPVIVGFGSATLFAPGLPEVALESHPAVVADRRALVDLVASVLAHVTGSERAAAAGTAATLAATTDAFAPGDVARAVGILAAPTVVSTAGDAAPAAAADARPWRGVVPPAGPVVGGLTESAPSGASESAALPAGVAAALAVLPAEWRHRVEELLAPLALRWARATPGRRRLVVAVTAATVVVVAAFAAGPASEPPPAAIATPDASPVPIAGSADGGEPDALPVELDDPAAVAALLLAERERCLAALDDDCLARVTDEGSAARAADLAALEAVRSGAATEWPRAADGVAVLAQSLGDSALVDLPVGADIARLLVIRGPEGWRIRSYFAPPDAPGNG